MVEITDTDLVFLAKLVDEGKEKIVTIPTLRKSVDLLTPEDFAVFPIWEYDDEWIEGRDETWVRPIATAVVPQRSYTHVAADFTAACGRICNGYVTVSTLGRSPEVCQGVIFHGGAALFVSNPEAFGFRQSRNELLSTLTLSESELFPLSFRLRVPVEDYVGQVAGLLP
jgi:hypothetical protein